MNYGTRAFMCQMLPSLAGALPLLLCVLFPETRTEVKMSCVVDSIWKCEILCGPDHHCSSGPGSTLLKRKPARKWIRTQNALIKKENQIFLIYKEIQNGAVAKSYMTNGLLIYGKYLHISSYIRKPFLIYYFASAPLWISLYTVY